MAGKNSRKAEAPIDRRETFVSIQKNFADSETGVEGKLKTLYALQKADTEIDRIIQFRGELPNEVKALEEEIDSISSRLAAVSAEIVGLQSGIIANKQNIVECDDLLSRYKGQLEGIANSREYDSVNKEIENQELLRQIAIKNISEAEARIKMLGYDKEDISNELEARNADLSAKKGELDGIVESTAKEETKLRADREVCAAKIDARTLSAYERIRGSVHNHLAVVTLYNGNSCGGCFSTVIPQRLIEISSNRRMIICENCGRIIVNPDFEGPKE